MNEQQQQPKTFEEVEVLIWKSPDELTEPEIENYLRIAEIREELDRENLLAVLYLA